MRLPIVRQEPDPMNAQDEARAIHFIQHLANFTLATTRPSMVTNAPDSTSVRLRWFGLRLNPQRPDHVYLVGLNIHYGGNWGGAWVINQTTNQKAEFHPHRPVVHGFDEDVMEHLMQYIYDADPALLALLLP